MAQQRCQKRALMSRVLMAGACLSAWAAASAAGAQDTGGADAGQGVSSPAEQETPSGSSKAEPSDQQPGEQPGVSKPGFEIYGAAQVDYIQDFNRVDPNWTAALRPSKIPTTPDEFGSDGQSIVSVRQSKLGVTAEQDILGQPLFVKVEFDLFGTGADEGQTTFHLQHAFGRWGPILIGKTDTLFMDISIFPDTIEYWGPPGMPFLRNPQIRFTWKQGPHELAGAVEQPSNDVDPGQLRLIDPALGNVQGVTHVPDFTGRYRYTGSWGHIQIAGILRQVSFETLGTTDNNPKGSKLGWGVNLTSNVKITKDNLLHLGFVYGEGIASYMNDGGTDLAPAGAPLGPGQLGFPPPPGEPIHAESEPLFGVVAYLDHAWNSHFSSSVGYSINQVNNSDLQEPGAFHSGQYATANLLWRPDSHILFGVEYQWGQRQDFDQATGNDNRVQFTAKYSFTSKDFLR